MVSGKDISSSQLTESKAASCQEGQGIFLVSYCQLVVGMDVLNGHQNCREKALPDVFRQMNAGTRDG